jgi:hypothetical protein
LANEEPRQVVFAFRRAKQRIEFDTRDRTTGDILVSFSGSASEVHAPFWRSLRRLQTDWAEAEWHWQFPQTEMRQLGTIVGALKTAG